MAIAVLFTATCTGCLDLPVQTLTPEMELRELDQALSLLAAEGNDIDTAKTVPVHQAAAAAHRKY
ncbi:MAG: hypothetical protein V2B15_05920 [Bacteroidota bacterium]